MKLKISRILTRRFLVISIIIMAFIAILYSPIMRFGDVKITGNTTISREDILYIAHLDEPINLFSISTNSISKQLNKDLRIQSANVYRSFPNHLNIDITERHAVAVVKCNYGYVNLDKNGLIVSTYMDLKKIDLPVITGIILEDVYTGETVDNETIAKVLAYLGFIKEEFLKQIIQIDVKEPNNIVVYTVKGVKIKVGSLANPQDLADKTNAFLADVKVEGIPIEYVDFSYKRPVLKIKH